MPGQPSKLNSWPWIAAVGYSNPDIPGAVDYLCGGTLVTSRYALVSGGVFLRRQFHEIFVFCFFHQTTFLGPKRHVQKRFRIISDIHGVICIRNWLHSDEYTEARSRLEPLGNQFFKLDHTYLRGSSNLTNIFRIIVPLNIVVFSLKSAKRLPGV
jgi:hypothetical protein